MAAFTVDKTWAVVVACARLPDSHRKKGRPAWQKSVWIHSALETRCIARQRHRQKSDEKQSNQVTEKKLRKKRPEAAADEPSRAHRSGNPIGRAYNGRDLILDSRK
jgi:hypothetical protein